METWEGTGVVRGVDVLGKALQADAQRKDASVKVKPLSSRRASRSSSADRFLAKLLRERQIPNRPSESVFRVLQLALKLRLDSMDSDTERAKFSRLAAPLLARLKRYRVRAELRQSQVSRRKSSSR